MSKPKKFDVISFQLPEGVVLKDAISHNRSVELIVDWSEMDPEKRVCPYCQSKHCVVKDSGATQTVRHVPYGFRAVFLTFHKPRFLCRECNRSFYLKPSWVIPHSSVTFPLYMLIYDRLTSTHHSLSEIARETMTSPAIIQNLLDHIEFKKASYLPEALGIDEFHGSTGFYDKDSKRYKTVFPRSHVNAFRKQKSVSIPSM